MSADEPVAFIDSLDGLLRSLRGGAGRAEVGGVFGRWEEAVGAAIAAYAGGFFRVLLGDYHLMFVSAGILGFIAVTLVSRIPESGLESPPGTFEAAPA